ncbi:hypothetical protein D3C85_1076270 [compost metagenome]
MYIESKEAINAWAIDIKSSIDKKDANQAMVESIPGIIHTCRKILSLHGLSISDNGCEYYGEYVISKKSRLRLFIEGLFK